MPLAEIALTPEQETEFDTPLLKIFAASYQKFRHSSPCTTNRKMFKYFEPMKPEELSDDEILFGKNREKAYKKLIADFKACLMTHEFDKFFEGKTHWWTSKTMPRLVILKKWLDAGP